MTATVLAFDGTPLVYSVDGDDLAYLTDCSAEHDRNLVNDRVERTLWGSTSYVPRVGNRRMLCIGIVEEREGGIWTGRTPSGALDGSTVTPI